MARRMRTLSEDLSRKDRGVIERRVLDVVECLLDPKNFAKLMVEHLKANTAASGFDNKDVGKLDWESVFNASMNDPTVQGEFGEFCRLLAMTAVNVAEGNTPSTEPEASDDDEDEDEG